MSRINTNINSLISQRILGQQNNSLSKTLERLSTGYQINRGADNPSGLIASERLRSEKTALGAAINNAERANQVANIAEGALQEVSSLLLEVQSLVSESANDTGLSPEEKQANQLQVDAILETIDRISATTSFGSTKLLNGSLDFEVSSVAATVADYTVNGAKIGEGDTQAVKAVVTASAQHAALFVSTAGALDLTDSDSTFVFEVGGAKGTREFSFTSGATAADIVSTINSFKDVTGVSAATQGTGIMLKSTEFGSDQSVSFDVIDDGGQAGAVHNVSAIDEDVVKTAGGTAFTAVSSPIRDKGQDVAAFINGVAARGQGKVASIKTDALDIEIELTTAGATAAGSISAMTIEGGGAKFNIGSTVDMNNQVRLGLGDVSARKLGNATDGYLDSLRSGGANNLVNGNLTDAQKVVGNVVNEVSGMRARIGAFQSLTLDSALNSLNVALENTSAAESMIRDTDFAAETADMTRNQILVQAATSALAISNARPQSILQLLG
jgi:flagellin